MEYNKYSTYNFTKSKKQPIMSYIIRFRMGFIVVYSIKSNVVDGEVSRKLYCKNIFL